MLESWASHDISSGLRDSTRNYKTSSKYTVIELIENTVTSISMSTTLEHLDGQLWFLDKNHFAVPVASKIVTNAYATLAEDDELRKAFNDFALGVKMPFLIFYLTY